MPSLVFLYKSPLWSQLLLNKEIEKDQFLSPSYSSSYFKAYRAKYRLKLTKKDKKQYIIHPCIKSFLKKNMGGGN